MVTLGAQFETKVFKRIRQMTYSRSFNMMKHICDDIIEQFLIQRDFNNVTGNALTSFTVGLYYDSRLVYIKNMRDEVGQSPTMKTLKKGQYYPLKKYFMGPDVEGKPYQGEFGGGGQWGPTLGPRKIKASRPVGRNKWNIIAVCPVSYAKYNREIYDTVERVALNLPDIVNINTVFFEDVIM